MAFCIEKFSSALCLVVGTGQSLDDFPPECFNLTYDNDDIQSVICKLNEIFEKEFFSITYKLFVEKDIKDLDLLMEAILPMFIEISANPTYFSFLLVCSLAQTFVFQLFNYHECYSFAMVISLCLRIVYEKCYNEQFRENAEGFVSFCKLIKPHLIPEDDKVSLPSYQIEQIRSLLSSLIHIESKNIKLTSEEMDRFYHILAPVPPGEDDDEESTDMSVSHSSTDVEEAMDCLSLDDKANDTFCVNRICSLCEGKCVKYLVSYRKEVSEDDL